MNVAQHPTVVIELTKTSLQGIVAIVSSTAYMHVNLAANVIHNPDKYRAMLTDTALSITTCLHMNKLSSPLLLHINIPGKVAAQPAIAQVPLPWQAGWGHGEHALIPASSSVACCVLRSHVNSSEVFCEQSIDNI
eukprot:5756694-Amphidinium_carterae.1